MTKFQKQFLNLFFFHLWFLGDSDDCVTTFYSKIIIFLVFSRMINIYGVFKHINGPQKLIIELKNV